MPSRLSIPLMHISNSLNFTYCTVQKNDEVKRAVSINRDSHHSETKPVIQVCLNFKDTNSWKLSQMMMYWYSDASCVFCTLLVASFALFHGSWCCINQMDNHIPIWILYFDLIFVIFFQCLNPLLTSKVYSNIVFYMVLKNIYIILHQWYFKRYLRQIIIYMWASPNPIASELFIILNHLQQSMNILKQQQ